MNKGKSKKNILVVDDNLAEKYAAVLRNIGNIYIAKNSLEAYEQINKQIESNDKFDVFSLDNYFPKAPTLSADKEGNEIAKMIREKHRPKCRIIGLSANPEEFDKKYFDVILNKRTTDPLFYRETVTEEDEKVSKDRILVISENEPIAASLKRVLKTLADYRVKTMTKVPERADLHNYDKGIIIVYDENLKRELIYRLWDIKEGYTQFQSGGHSAHDIVPASDAEPLTPRIICLSFDEDKENKWAIKVPFNIQELFKKLKESE